MTSHHSSQFPLIVHDDRLVLRLAHQDVQNILRISEGTVLTTLWCTSQLLGSFGMMPTCDPVRSRAQIHHVAVLIDKFDKSNVPNVFLFLLPSTSLNVDCNRSPDALALGF